MSEAPSPTKWTPDELKRFYRAYHKYGTDFQKISKMVGGGKAPEMCHSIWKRHEAYLSLDKEFQGEIAFVAMVQDTSNLIPDDLQPTRPNVLDDDLATIVKRAQPSGAEGLNSDDGHKNGLFRNGGLSHRRLQLKPDVDIDDDGEDGYMSIRNDGIDDGNDAATAAAAVVAMASPGGTSLLSTRPRRTPKRPGSHSRTPSKRHRDTDNDDIYEYYDPMMAHLTESAKKRRATQKRLDFESQSRQKQWDDGDDGLKGFEALLALAEASNGGTARGHGSVAQRKDAHSPHDGDEELTDDDDALGINNDDEKDEDYRAGNRTPHSTPAKGRRPGSTHATPRRSSAGRAAPGASPGSGMRTLGSPGWLGGLGDGGADLLGEFGGAGMDFPHLFSSPGLPSQLPPGFIPSPKNPLPRVRRRKNLPERSPIHISPLKGLHSRRNLGSSAFLAMTGLSLPGINNLMDEHAGPAVTDIERQLRRCLNPRMRKWINFEFFYSAIDRPWFMDTTFIITDLASHLGLSDAAGTAGSSSQAQPLQADSSTSRPLMLTRKQWSLVRVSLGRPRRLSWTFLRDSRARLEAYRIQARRFYTEAAPDRTLSAIIPRPIAVGQRVIARHPVTRRLHDGSILTTAHHNYRVQFDREELGVELIKDVDVMPYEPWENLPLEYLVRRRTFVMAGRLIVDGRAVEFPLPRDIVDVDDAAGGRAGDLDTHGVAGGSSTHRINLGSSSQRDATTTAAAAAAAAAAVLPDPALMAELAATLDKKESLLVQLRRMNDEVNAGAHTDPVTGMVALSLREMYVQVVEQLREVNAALTAKMQRIEEGSGGGGGGGGGLLFDEELFVRAGETSLLPESIVESGPVTAQTLSDASLAATETIIEKCLEKLQCEHDGGNEDGKNEKKEHGHAAEDLDNAAHAELGENVPLCSQESIPNEVNSGKEGENDEEKARSSKASGIIKGAVWSLMTLQLGSDKIIPATVLAKALDTTILGVKPSSALNAGLYIEIEAAMKGLKMLLTGQEN